MPLRLVLGLLICLLPMFAFAGGPRALRPDDHRLGPLKDLNGYFPFDVPDSVEDWEARREVVRRQILVAAGLWPMPERSPVKAVVHGTVERDGYTVSRVYFESLPGLYVTGSLYKPTTGNGPFPTILCPHGHSREGRFHEYGPESVKEKIASGGERFKTGARHPKQALCVHLARMGCIAFQYDMIGYSDSVPLTYEIAHRFAEQRPKLSQPDKWGLFSPQAELRLINSFGLQTWNSLRAFDWVAERSDVDTDRIGVTGASGGGTQTFFLAAIEPRIAAAVPVVMVSTAMQGGCTCENASYLRIGTGNVEMAGVIAPRPLAMIAANDWTRELETKGLPELKALYAMLGAPGNVEGRHFDFPHNYNAVSRAMAYDFFKRHLGLSGPVEEQDFVPLSRDELTVWNEEHPKPASDTAAELALMRTIAARNQKQMASLEPTDDESLERYREVVGGALDVMIGSDLEMAGEVAFEPTSQKHIPAGTQTVGVLRNTTYHEELPVVVWTPPAKSKIKGTVIWPHVEGKAALYTDEAAPIPAVEKLLKHGYRVIAADLLGQGEFTVDGEPWEQARVVENPREFAGYTLGYNHPLFSKRTQDILSLITFAQDTSEKGGKIALLAFDEAAAWSACAAVQSGKATSRVALAPGDFRFAKITKIRDPNLLPGAVKYGDVPGLLALLAPRPLYLADGAADGLVKSVYQAAGKADVLINAGGKGSRVERAVDWLVGEE